MKAVKKVFELIVVAVMVGSLFAACGKTAQDQSKVTTQEDSVKQTANSVTLAYLCANENFPDNFKDFLAIYETTTGNEVDVQLFPASEYDKIIRTKMMSGMNFDLYRTDGIKFAEAYWPKDWPEDLSNRPWVSRLSVGAKAIIAWSDGKITGLPILNNGGFGIMYNKDIFTKVGITAIPKTWKAFLEVCEKIKQAGISPVNIQLANGSEFGTTHLMHQIFANIYLTHKNDINDMFKKLDSNKLKYSEVPEFEQALNQIYELKTMGYINKDFISTTFEMSQDKFGKGEVAMHPCGDFILQPLLSKYKDLKIGFFPAPFGDTQGVIAGYAGVGISVSSKGKYKQEALALVDMFASKEVQEKYMAKAPGIGVFTDVQSTNNMISADMELIANSGLVFSGIFEVLQSWPEMDARKVMQEMMLGAKTPKQMLVEMDKKAEIIAKGKKLGGW